MACGHETKDCVTGHMRERAELKAQGVARLNFRLLILFFNFFFIWWLNARVNARVCDALPPILVSSTASCGKVNSTFAGRSINTRKTCEL